MTLNITAENQGGSPVVIADLDVTVPGSGSYDLTKYRTHDEVFESADLVTKINSDDILLNDGGGTLGKQPSLDIINRSRAVKCPIAVTAGAVPRFPDTSGNRAMPSKTFVETDGRMHTTATDYETLVTGDDDFPNKKYVDDLVGGGAVVQRTEDEITVDTTTTQDEGGWSAFLSRSFTKLEDASTSDLRISFFANSSNDSDGKRITFRVTVGGTQKRRCGYGDNAKKDVGAPSMLYQKETALGVGAVTINIDWNTEGGTAQVRPVTDDREQALLVVEEVLK